MTKGVTYNDNNNSNTYFSKEIPMKKIGADDKAIKRRVEVNKVKKK